MIDFITSLPAWEMIRTLGIASYLLLFAGVGLGILYSMPIWKGKQKAAVYKYHSFLTVTATLCGILHAMLLTIDTYMPFSWKDILVPFGSEHDPIWNGLGTLALFGTLFLIFTTDIRNKLKRTLWLAIHMGAYPTFLLAMVHGLMAGSDTKNITIFSMYVATFGILMILLMIRFFMGRKRNVAHIAARR